jgi:hypothetical protein
MAGHPPRQLGRVVMQRPVNPPPRASVVRFHQLARKLLSLRGQGTGPRSRRRRFDSCWERRGRVPEWSGSRLQSGQGRFDSGVGLQWLVAQRTEQPPPKWHSAGSSPAGPADVSRCDALRQQPRVEGNRLSVEVGSTPARQPGRRAPPGGFAGSRTHIRGCGAAHMHSGWVRVDAGRLSPSMRMVAGSSPAAGETSA